MKKVNNNKHAQQVLINNLKNQLAEKKDTYNEMIYRAAIMSVVNEKIHVTKNNYLNIS